jgi:anaerobic dimethyl sulfoxide reductase subunit A
MSENNFLTNALKKSVLTRRSFLKWSAALGSATALFGGGMYGLETVEASTKNQQQDEGKWVPLPCFSEGCGGFCTNFGLVKNGVVIQQKSDDTHADSPENPLRKGCLRGRAQRTHVLGTDRLKYPMKRKNWAPGGGNKELRGKDEWVRISWDEALDLVATEIKRVKDSYGLPAIVAPYSPLLSAYGGFRQLYGVDSEGNYPLTREKMVGTDQMTNIYQGGVLNGPPDRFSQQKAKLIVQWGQNVAWSQQGSMYIYQQAKKAGVKFISVAPELNPSAVALEAQWIPVRPSTDAALLIGMAYYMIVNNLQDQAFLDKYTLGFDADHMPAGVDAKENFKDYVLGTYDSVPKTPEWASEICGTPPELIRSFAQEIATTKPMVFDSSNAPARTHRSQQFTMAFFTVGWMTGNVGLPNSAVCNSSYRGFGGPSLIYGGSNGEPFLINPLFTAGGMFGGYGFNNPFDKDFVGVAFDEQWLAILNNEVNAGARGKVPCDIRLYYNISTSNNAMNQTGGTTTSLKAIRKLDFIVSCDLFLTNKSKYADVVLPGTTPWEDVGFMKNGHDPENILCYRQVIDPLFEAKDIAWIETELAKRLGLDPNKIHPLSPKQRFFNQVAGTTYLNGKETVPLVTITADDIKAWGVTGKPQQGVITIEKFLDQGGYVIQRKPGDVYEMIASMPAQMFRADPVKNPAKTESGKLEIYCKELARYLNAFGFDKSEPIAKYERPTEGIEDTYADWDKKIKGDYPLQLCTPHYMRRAHTMYNNVPYLRRAFPQEMVMNQVDADARGLQNGDTVLVSSRHGKVLRHVNVTNFIIPGVVELGEGSWFEYDDAEAIDKGGCVNVLGAARPSGQGMEPFNSINVQVEKWTGAPLEPDYTWPYRTILGIDKA